MSLNILPECFADTEMIKIIGFKRANHCPSIGAVANKMKKNYKNRLAIGIVDRDKPGTIPSYFNNFEVIGDFEGFQVKNLPHTKHYLIVIEPALEQWIIDTAFTLDIPLKRYGFDTLKKLKRITKNQHVGRNENFKDLINRMHQKKSSPLKAMREEIEKLLDK